MIAALFPWLQGAARTLLRPAAGGGTAPTATWPPGVPTPPYPIEPPTPLPPIEPLPPSDISALVFILLIAAALIGFMRGVRREGIVLAVALLMSFVCGPLWPQASTLVNTFWNLMVSFLPGGFLPPVNIPPDESAVYWQVAFFVLGVVIFGYGGSSLVTSGPASIRGIGQIPSILERLLGAGIGALNGFLIARFVLSRILPEAIVTPFREQSALYGRVGAYGPFLALGVVVLLIVFGVLSIVSPPRGPKQKVFD